MLGTFAVQEPTSIGIAEEELEYSVDNGTSATKTFHFTGLAKGNYILHAIAEPVAGEIDMADNTFIDAWILVTIPGDINGDKRVDRLDAIRLANAFASIPGDPDWNPNADINGDGVVNILDAIILAGHFSESWP